MLMCSWLVATNRSIPTLIVRLSYNSTPPTSPSMLHQER